MNAIIIYSPHLSEQDQIDVIIKMIKMRLIFHPSKICRTVLFCIVGVTLPFTILFFCIPFHFILKFDSLTFSNTSAYYIRRMNDEGLVFYDSSSGYLGEILQAGLTDRALRISHIIRHIYLTHMYIGVCHAFVFSL